MKKIILAMVVCCVCLLSSFSTFASADDDNGQLCYHFDKKYTKITPFEANESYTNVPAPINTKISLAEKSKYVQPWDGYCPPATNKNAKFLPCQTHNIKPGNTYAGIQVKSNKWMHLANKVALEGVKHGGGPFGAVAVQIDDKTGKVIRYWEGYNHVVQWHDPTAHAEVVTIREVSKSLGVVNFRHIKKSESKLPQPSEYSHIELYSSAEPCPMCMSAIYWAGIPVLVFAATRYDAAQQGVAFADEMIYEELKRPYAQRKNIKAYQSTTDNSLDAFNLWKRTQHHYY